jgi:hypothetical protein
VSFTIRNGQSEVKGDFSKLEKIVAALGRKHSVKIGVFSDAKTAEGESVADYGAKNEFGVVTKKIPERSFIRMPLETKASKISDDVGRRAKQHIADGDVKAIFEDIGFAGEAAIQEAFDTRGFGTWKENAQMTIELKGSDAPLIDDGTLRKSITHKVE